MALLFVALGILLLLLLIVVFKVNAFIAFIIVSLAVGISEGMPLDKVVISVQNGIGNTLGFLVMILGFGSMLGKMVADSGAAQRITLTLIKIFGEKGIQYAMVLTGFLVGIPMFYSVGFVILVPLVFAVAASTRLPLLYVGIPLLASLSVTHGYLPPHPSPTAIGVLFKADIGMVLLYGIVVALPSILIAGVFFSSTLKKINAQPLKEFTKSEELTEDQMPGFAISLFTALLPLLLISISTLCNLWLPATSSLKSGISFMGNPVIALIIAVLVSVYTLGLSRGKKMTVIMDSLGQSVTSITLILLVIAGAGALSQILVDSGVSKYIAELLSKSSLSPLFLSWLIATIIRVCVGSATVAGLTTAGIVAPLATSGMANAELMVLAIGSGSLMLSHVNDSGFWLFKEYFNLNIKDTLRSWTMMETLVGVVGIVVIMIISLFV